jgi:hypothetical protein
MFCDGSVKTMTRTKEVEIEVRSLGTSGLEKAFQQELSKDQEAQAERTARLRGHRLAKEACEREAEDLQASKQVSTEENGNQPK